MAEPFETTVVGSMPKPPWLYRQASLDAKESDHHGGGADWLLSGQELEEAQNDAVRLAIYDQETAGVRIISDGEQRRKSYLTHITSQLGGFDYETLAEKSIRDGRRLAQVGRCTGPVKWLGPMVVNDLHFLLTHTTYPVKVTLPGPMTVVDSTYDAYYGDERTFALAVADAISQEAKALDAMGPAVIQFDEPVFSRYPEKVAKWGIEALDRCADGLRAQTAVHVCYSYAMPGVERPIKPSYPQILAELERSKIDQLALEFEAPQLDPAMLEFCPSKTILFGCIDNASPEIEDAEQIALRLLAAAEHHDPEKIQAAPDCGLTLLSQSVARAKLAALFRGSQIARVQLTGNTGVHNHGHHHDH
jgi:5-methyltetrahydropteroyltriglutamate--homocysteine methyltransferase